MVKHNLLLIEAYGALNKRLSFTDGLGVIALVFNVAGALLVAGATYQLEGYCLFLVGALVWCWQSWLTGNRAALLQWAFFTAVNIYGTIQRT